MYEIQDDIKAPGKAKNKGLTERLRQLNVGQSMVVPLSSKRSIYPLAKQINIKVASQVEKSDKFEMIWVEELKANAKHYPIIGIRVFRIE